MKLGRLLKLWKIHNEMSASEMAASIGIPLMTYRRLEQGSKAQPETLQRIFQWLAQPEIVTPPVVTHEDSHQTQAA